MKFYIARDQPYEYEKQGQINLYTTKPKSYKLESGVMVYDKSHLSQMVLLPISRFPNLTFSDGPVEVELVRKGALEKEYKAGYNSCVDAHSLQEDNYLE